MSSYLNIYVVPKKVKIKYDWENTTEKGPKKIETKISEGVPLLLYSYSRGSEIYSALKESLNIEYIGNGDSPKYTTVLLENMQEAVKDAQREVDSWKSRIERNQEAFNSIKSPTKDATEDYLEEYASNKEYVEELESTKAEIVFLKELLESMEYSDFEKKFLMNYD